jgi:hypothetical protein
MFFGLLVAFATGTDCIKKAHDVATCSFLTSRSISGMGRKARFLIMRDIVSIASKCGGLNRY